MIRIPDLSGIGTVKTGLVYGIWSDFKMVSDSREGIINNNDLVEITQLGKFH